MEKRWGAVGVSTIAIKNKTIAVSKKRGAPQGNKNGAKGPRVGRKDKTTKPLPQPRLEAMAKLPKRRKQEKTLGCPDS